MATADVVRIWQYAENAALQAQNPGSDPFVNIFNQTVDAASGITVDSSGVIYVADAGRHCIWKLRESLKPIVFAGKKGTSGDVVGTATAARFNAPKDMACDKSGNLYVFDSGNGKIKRINTNGQVSTVTRVAASTAVSLTVAPNGTIFAVASHA